MATLKCKWLFDEGSGTTAYDSVSSNNGQLTVVSGFPAFTTEDGRACIENDGDAYSGGGKIVCDKTANDLSCSLAGDHSWTLRLKLASDATLNRGILGIPYGDPPLHKEAIYVDNSGYVRHGIEYKSGDTRVYDSAASGADMRDGAFHFYAFTVDADGTGYNVVQRSYKDGALVETVSVNALYQLENTRDGSPWWLTYAYVVGHENTVIGGALDGFLGEMRFYCGRLTDGEIEDIYNDVTSPANAIMFSCNT
jgi:hypothetical protein